MSTQGPFILVPGDENERTEMINVKVLNTV